MMIVLGPVPKSLTSLPFSFLRGSCLRMGAGWISKPSCINSWPVNTDLQSMALVEAGWRIQLRLEDLQEASTSSLNLWWFSPPWSRPSPNLVEGKEEATQKERKSDQAHFLRQAYTCNGREFWSYSQKQALRLGYRNVISSESSLRGSLQGLGEENRAGEAKQKHHSRRTPRLQMLWGAQSITGISGLIPPEVRELGDHTPAHPATGWQPP